MDDYTRDDRQDRYIGPEELRESAQRINALIKSADDKISSVVKICADVRDKIQLNGGMLDASGEHWTFERWFLVNVQMRADTRLSYSTVKKLIGVGPVVAQRRAERAAAAASRQKSTEQVWENISTGTKPQAEDVKSEQASADLYVAAISDWCALYHSWPAHIRAKARAMLDFEAAQS